MKLKHLALIFAVSVGLGFVTGCQHTVANNPPTAPALAKGAINSFDATSYQTLMTAQAVLNSLKGDAASFPQFTAQLNEAITSYDLAETAWQAYHAAASTSGQQQVEADLTNLNIKISSVQQAMIQTKQGGAK